MPGPRPVSAGTLLSLLLCGVVLLGGCVQARQIYPLESRANPAGTPRGSVQIERIEGHQRLFALRLEELGPPESWGPDCAVFAAWVEDSHGHTVKLGVLRYDRARRSATLLGAAPDDTARRDFRAFTVKVTAEREASAEQPGQVLVSERRVMDQ